MEGMPSEMVVMSQQMAEALTESGAESNLLGVLANSSLLHVPTLLGGGGSRWGTRLLVEVESPLAAILLLIGFSLLGVLIGVVYMNMLARTLPLGDAPKAASVSEFVTLVMRHWLMVLFYVVLLVVALLLGSIPFMLVVSLLSLLSPAISTLVVMMITGTLVVLFFYLYFVTAAVIMDNLPVHRAIVQSFVVVRNNFWATLGFIILYNLISLGFAYIMMSMAEMTAVGTVAAILIYAYIGSGLAMALLVFYRTRLLKQEDRSVTVT